MRRRDLVRRRLFAAVAVGTLLCVPFLSRALKADERQVDPIIRKENLYIEIQKVEGTDEAGTLKVYGVVVPQKNVQSSKIMVNGSVVVTGGAFTAGDFTFTVDQNSLTLVGKGTVEVTLTIDGEDNTVGFKAERTPTSQSGSAWYHEVYAVEGFGLMPYRFLMRLSEQYAKMQYSIDQSKNTALLDKASLTLVDLPQGEMGDPFMQGGEHKYVTGEGDLYPLPFGTVEFPVMAGEHDINRDCLTRKWVTPGNLDSVQYGQGTVLVGLSTPAGPSLPCMWCLMSNDKVKAPNQ